MSMAWDRYRDAMSEFNDESPYTRPHLADNGYEYEDGYWFAVFVDKEVVARKDYPSFGIKKGEKHRYVSFKYICDETGASSWEVKRKSLRKVVNPVSPVSPAPVSWGTSPSQWGFNSTESSWTGSWTRKDK